jgi:hypothetical protein
VQLLRRSQRVDLITGENHVLGPDDCFDDLFVPYPNLGLREDLLATVPVTVPDGCEETIRDEPVEIPVVTRDEKVEAFQISVPAVSFPIRKRLVSDVFGCSTDEHFVEVGVKTCFVDEVVPWAKAKLVPSVG